MPSNRAKKKISEYVLFNVEYEDGFRSSNRKVPGAELEGPDRDAPAKAIIEAQDRQIAEFSGKAPRIIKAVQRSGR